MDVLVPLWQMLHVARQIRKAEGEPMVKPKAIRRTYGKCMIYP